MSTRKASVAGTFYPAECSEIEKYIEHFNAIFNESGYKERVDITPRAIIAPHAGYVYSGFTANAVYRTIQHMKPKRVIVVGPSHKVFIEGISIARYDMYETPCKELMIDNSYSQKIEDKFDFIFFDPAAHNEHSTETQIPFIAHYFKDIDIVEMVYGRVDYQKISEVLDFVFQDRDNLLVISTDLSHFYDLQSANTLDNICLKAIVEKEIRLLDAGCEACGKIGVKALLESVNKIGLQSVVVDYRTSADMSGDSSRVVGYVSAVFYES
ncbi:MAG: AmmeMemoRadiSam system protein B [Campylobacterales bacterium]|nr:AmmeMemoRadiSam system protein B [Campylobacterales bacterium]